MSRGDRAGRCLGLASAVALASCGLDVAPLDPWTAPAPDEAGRPPAAPQIGEPAASTALHDLAALGPDGARRVSVAVGDDDRAVVAWTTAEGPGVGGTFVADEAKGFATEALSARLPGYSDSPSVALSSGGKAVVAFQQTDRDSLGRVMIATRENRGTDFDAPTSLEETLSLPLLHSYEPQAVATPDGEQIVVWNQWRGTGFSVALTYRAPGSAWLKPQSTDDLLSAPVFHSNAPRPSVGPDGALVITWYQSPDGYELMVFASERARSGSPMSRPTPADFVSRPGAPASSAAIANPRAAIAEDGRAAIAWAQDTAPGAARIFAAVRAAGTTFVRGMPVDVLSAPDAIAASAQPVFVGRALHVVWEERRASDPPRILETRLDATGWSTPRVLSTPGSKAFLPAVSSARNRAVVAFAESVGDGRYRVMTSVAESDGAFGPATRVSAESSPSVEDVAAAVGTGPGARIVVAWTHGASIRGRVHLGAVRSGMGH